MPGKTESLQTENPQVALIAIAHEVAMIASTSNQGVRGVFTHPDQYPEHFDRIFKALMKTLRDAQKG